MLDLAGVARDHALDVLAAALALPVATEPHLVTFAAEGPWRGETHRLCDRPGALTRVIEEVAAAGAEQVILLAATPRAARPHELSAAPRRRPRPRRRGARRPSKRPALRDVLEQFAGRFAGLYVIRPEHNPVGPFDFGGGYDERSDRTLHASPSSSTAATRTPTASSSTGRRRERRADQSVRAEPWSESVDDP